LLPKPPNYISKLHNLTLIKKIEILRPPLSQSLLIIIRTSSLSDSPYQTVGRENPGNLLTKWCSFPPPHNKMSLMTFTFTYSSTTLSYLSIFWSQYASRRSCDRPPRQRFSCEQFSLSLQANGSQVPSFYCMLLKQTSKFKLIKIKLLRFKTAKLSFQMMRFAIISETQVLTTLVTSNYLRV
jgi:hypothetical protein